MGTFRFLLALAVVIGHFGGLWGHRYISAPMAVECFYIVSGFLIAFIIHEKYDTTAPEGLRLFYTNRLLRIFVPYWLFIVLLCVVPWIAAPSTMTPTWVSYWSEMTVATKAYVVLTNLFIVGQDWVFWLLYDHGALQWTWNSDAGALHVSRFHMIPQAWTISLELMFYAIAPFVVRRNWLLLLAYVVAAYYARRYMHTHGFDGAGFVYRFFPLELGLFFCGVLAYRAYAFIERHVGLYLPISIAATAAIISMMFAMRYWPHWDQPAFFLFTAAAMPGLFHFSRCFSFDRWLGELSYPIYLSHLGVLIVGEHVASGIARDPNVFALVLIAITVAISAAYVSLFDVPFERWRQRRTSINALALRAA